MAAPLRVVIYGSSLFLMALTASLKRHPELEVIPLTLESQPAIILQHAPAVILYQADNPPPGVELLLATGLRCAELNTHHSQITLRQDQHPQERYSIAQSQDLVAAITAKE